MSLLRQLISLARGTNMEALSSRMPLLTSFPEENHLLPVAQGGGFFLAHMGDTLKSGRYHILRKLGLGQYSSTWLVRDSHKLPPRSYYAAKILSSAATKLHARGVLMELNIWQSIPPNPHTLTLYDYFYHEGPDGPQLCFISAPLSIDISTYRRSLPQNALRPYVLKPILARVIECLTVLHSANIIHTDIKPTNILLNIPNEDQEIEKALLDPVEFYGEFEDRYGIRHPVWASQPLQHKLPLNLTPSQAELIGIHLIDFGHAQRSNKLPTAEVFSPFALRAPELLLGGALVEAIDIWAVGCLTFEMLTGKWLFDPKATVDSHMEDDHLAQMMELTEEDFTPELLDRFPLKGKFFNENGGLLRPPKRPRRSLEADLLACPVLKLDEVSSVATFIRDCIRLDHSQRPSAHDLEFHTWIMDAFMPGYIWTGPSPIQGN